MENRIDFLNWLNPDVSINILTCLEDPSDFLRVSGVSRSWRRYVIANGLCKQLCLRMFPLLSKLDHVIEASSDMKEPAEVGLGSVVEWQNMEREHRAYAFLARGCSTFPIGDLISEPSSTDNYPEGSIHNTLEPMDTIAQMVSYWSSKGQSTPAEPEMLLYKLVGDLCVITELIFSRVYLYTAEAVRFRMGHLKHHVNDPIGESYKNYEDKLIWTYTSQEFPMAQEDRLQKFKLPEPVLCIGGFFLIEMLGRGQGQEDMDGLFYICVSDVQIVGRSLSPSFSIGCLEPSGKFALKVLSYTLPTPEDPSAIQSANLQRRVSDEDVSEDEFVI